MERACSASSSSETPKRGRSKGKIINAKWKATPKGNGKKKESRGLPTKTPQFGDGASKVRASPSFSFSSFVGHCFSFTQIPQHREAEETDDADTDQGGDAESYSTTMGSMRRKSPGRGNSKGKATKSE